MTLLVVEEEPLKSKRLKKENNFGFDFLTSFLTESCVLNESLMFVFILEEHPMTYDEAMKSVDAIFWKEAIDSELDSIMSNNTWELADFSRGCKPIFSTWIFKKKLKLDGSIDKYKARLIVRGFTQKKGINYYDNDYIITKIATIRTLIALAALYGLKVHQMDVKTTFLNGDLEEEIYMDQLEGCVVSGQGLK